MTLARKANDTAGREARSAAPGSDPASALPGRRSWTQIAGLLVSVAILAGVLWQLRTLRLAELRNLFPTSISFWGVFAVYYLAGPAADWIIFRRLWSIPLSGTVALLRKLISNEILFGYLGEVYFYTWARRNVHKVGAPFGAIKDVSVLSALVGNATTLIMMLATAPLLNTMDFGLSTPMSVVSVAVLCLPSFGIFVFRKKLFILPKDDLRFVSVVHLTRIIATTLLAAVMWHMLLPAVPVTLWLVLGTLRLVVSRLPFVPNKDLVFAGFAVFFVGKDAGIASAMALMATLILAVHLCVGALLGAAELTREARGL